MKKEVFVTLLFILSILIIGCATTPVDNEQDSETQQDTEDQNNQQVPDENQNEDTETKEESDDTTNEIESMKSCTTDEECVPEPTCHPQNCVNKIHLNELPEKPDICTMMFDPTAAYEEEHCICVDSVCTNTNAE